MTKRTRFWPWVAIVAFVLSVTPSVFGSDEVSPAGEGCSWSVVWPKVKAGFTIIPADAKVTQPTRKRGGVHRPRSGIQHTIEGNWRISAIVDERGDRSAHLIGMPCPP
jgi:hypothetical protein